MNANTRNSSSSSGSGGNAAGLPDTNGRLVDMGTSSEESLRVYNGWASSYENKMKEWGYNIPEKTANIIRDHIDLVKTDSNVLHWLDAGAGTGLLGLALRELGGPRFSQDRCVLTAADLSPEMLNELAEKGCYNHTEVVDMNSPPMKQFDSGVFDLITCIATLTYVDPKGGILTEFARLVKPTGLVCFSHRTDKVSLWADEQERLVETGKWKLVQKFGPLPFIPQHEEFTDEVELVLFLYQRL